MPELEASRDEYQVKLQIVEALRTFDDELKRNILKAVAAFYGLAATESNGAARVPADARRRVGPTTNAEREPTFSDHQDLSPKQFLQEKQPHSDVERVACLAYYLAHYRNIPHFKTVDVSKLNTEAAQFKFSNAALAVNNAAWRGLLTSAGKGNKQISAVGEQFVVALPDRDATKRVLERLRFRRDRGKSRSRSRLLGRQEITS
jgi:hypothetical protein